MPVMKKKKKADGKKTLVMLHDGVHWHAGIQCSDGSWTQKQEAASKVTVLPDSMLEWAVANGALLVRVALPAELHEFSTETSGLLVLNEAEIYQSLAFELAEKTGMEAEELAPSIAPCNALGMGTDANFLIGTAFERELLFGYSESCRYFGLKFEGTAALQSLALAAHADNKASDRESLLFLGEKESFAVGFAGDERTMSFRAIPMSCPGAVRSADYDRRLERRIKPYLGQALHLVAPGEGLEHAVSCLTELGVTDGLRSSPFGEHRTEWMGLLAGASRHILHGPIGLIGLPPKVRDEKFTGGIICAATMAITLLVLGSLWGVKFLQKIKLEKLHADIQALEQAQSSAKSGFEAVNKELKNVRRLHGSLSKVPAKVDGHFTEILTALADTLPQYSKITSVVQTNDVTLITGSTIWAQEVSDCSMAIQKKLQPLRLRVVPKSMKPDPETDVSVFTMEVK